MRNENNDLAFDSNATVLSNWVIHGYTYSGRDKSVKTYHSHIGQDLSWSVPTEVKKALLCVVQNLAEVADVFLATQPLKC